MLTFSTVHDVRQRLKPLSRQEKSIGFVPTMGALHQGHLSLIRKSKQENDYTVCSIFVNPTQFNNPEDLEKYPRTLDDDIKLLEKEGCDFVFLPTNKNMYPSPSKTSFSFGELEQSMEGQYRPGHFNGVALVVSKLFHIVNPDRAYFGQKDYQQCMVIKQMAEDLFFDIEIVVCPTIRETSDGLAMSSRNLRLSAEARQKAPILYKILQAVKENIQNGATISDAKSAASNILADYPDITLDYIEVVDETRHSVLNETDKKSGLAVCGALYIDSIRLIDNLTF